MPTRWVRCWGSPHYLEDRGVHTVVSFPERATGSAALGGAAAGLGTVDPTQGVPEGAGRHGHCDCAAFDRLAMLGPVSTRAHELIWIDHHRSNDGLGTIRLVDPAASSTCEMVFRLIEAMGGGMSDATALCLYAGLVTDTGRFQYEATTSETLRVAAALRDHDFDHTRLVQALYEDNRMEYIRLVARRWTAWHMSPRRTSCGPT